MAFTPVFQPAGDSALVVELGCDISEKTNARVRDMAEAVERAAIRGVVAVLPSYRSLLVQYEPLLVSYSALAAALAALSGAPSDAPAAARTLDVPVLYGGDAGPDMASVCAHCGLGEAEVVRLHSMAPYRIYMLGFSPGFPYLGGMDARLETPRLPVPRARIPGGSVGIAGAQTGVYPSERPGGWRLIGRTPLRLYDPDRDPPILTRAGDRIRFVPVGADEYRAIRAAVADGAYRYRLYHDNDGEGGA